MTATLATARDSLESLQSRAVESCLTSLAPASRRVYAARIRDYLAWSKGQTTKGETICQKATNSIFPHSGMPVGSQDCAESGHNTSQETTSLFTVSPRRREAKSIIAPGVSKSCPLDREHIQRYMRALELQAASPQVRNQALAALKKLACEAAELSWIEHAAAAQVGRIKARRITGIRSGKWLTRDQAQRLLAAPDRTTVTGRRDSVVLALLLGCGLRRDEAVRLGTAQCVTIDGRMVLRNVEGKGGRIRSVSVPRWAQTTIENWIKELTA